MRTVRIGNANPSCLRQMETRGDGRALGGPSGVREGAALLIAEGPLGAAVGLERPAGGRNPAGVAKT
jgi:hypothetical protein